jgi:hypothetical protein
MSTSILRTLYPVTAGRLSLVALGILRAWLSKQPNNGQRFAPVARDLGKVRHGKGLLTSAVHPPALPASKTGIKSLRDSQVVDKLVGIPFAAAFTLFRSTLLPPSVGQWPNTSKEGGQYPLLQVKKGVETLIHDTKEVTRSNPQDKLSLSNLQDSRYEHLHAVYAYAMLEVNNASGAMVIQSVNEKPEASLDLNLALLQYVHLSCGQQD